MLRQVRKYRLLRSILPLYHLGIELDHDFHRSTLNSSSLPTIAAPFALESPACSSRASGQQLVVGLPRMPHAPPLRKALERCSRRPPSRRYRSPRSPRNARAPLLGKALGRWPLCLASRRCRGPRSPRGPRAAARGAAWATRSAPAVVLLSRTPTATEGARAAAEEGAEAMRTAPAVAPRPSTTRLYLDLLGRYACRRWKRH